MERVRRRARRLLARVLRLDVERVDDGCLVVQRAPARHRVVHVGGRDLGVRLLLRTGVARRRPHLLQRRLSEYLVREQVAWVLRATRVNCVLDVGANVGQYAQALRAAGYRGRIVSFEPVAGALAALRRAAAADPEWHVMPYALGSRDGTAEIHADPKTLSSLLPASEFGREWSSRLGGPATETIEVRRLDSVLGEVTAGLRPVRAFLKLDTQGFDLEAFRGASGVLDSVVAMQSEVALVPLYDGMPRLPEQLAAYEAEGFEAAGMFQVSRDLPTLRVIEFDLVMVRPAEVRDPLGHRR
jgi:FkbM family methyltransferase